MGVLFTLTPAVRNITQQAIEDLLQPAASGGLGKTCRLVFPNLPGQQGSPVTKDIVVLVAYQPQHFWVKPAPGVQIPAGTVQTKGYLTDAPAIRQARAMVLQPEASGTAQWRYALDGDPVDVSNIVQDKFCVSWWRRTP